MAASRLLVVVGLGLFAMSWLQTSAIGSSGTIMLDQTRGRHEHFLARQVSDQLHTQNLQLWARNSFSIAVTEYLSRDGKVLRGGQGTTSKGRNTPRIQGRASIRQ
ncbi:hypothetical protein X797_007323 [Metarhizium robertsii]|uniref:Uncharacterized protein n=1 Tax=Metarhizium robertsii TaxID=568076 RepID=A0A014NCX3_9HYPO|nr:hypothetical protein X797_007323 [Metarhizium robertsii]